MWTVGCDTVARGALVTVGFLACMLTPGALVVAIVALAARNRRTETSR